jgi:NitT/TauT family transport system substrate-binding protein
MITDPTIKPFLVEDAAEDAKVLQRLGRMKEFDVAKWVDDSYVRKAYADLKLDYDAQLKAIENYEVKGEDKFCSRPVTDPRKAGEVWVDGEGILPFSSTVCTLGAYAQLKSANRKINMAYVFDTARGIKLFADQAFYAVGSDKKDIAPFLLKKDAEAQAGKNGGKVLSFEEALKLAASGG